MMEKHTLSSRLRMLRREKGDTQRSLAQKTGISYSSIIDYENGRCLPSSKAMAALEKYFGVTGAYLRGEEDSAPAGQDAAPVVEQYIGAMESGEASSAGAQPAGVPAADPCRAYSSVKARVEQVICVTVTQSDHSGRLSERRQLYSLDGRLLGVGIDLAGV